MKTIHPSPFIYLKGFKGVDLEYVVDFLYNGEALIAQEELENFLDTAHELQLKGLQSSIQDGLEHIYRVKENAVESKLESNYNMNQYVQPEQNIFDQW